MRSVVSPNPTEELNSSLLSHHHLHLDEESARKLISLGPHFLSFFSSLMKRCICHTFSFPSSQSLFIYWMEKTKCDHVICIPFSSWSKESRHIDDLLQVICFCLSLICNLSSLLCVKSRRISAWISCNTYTLAKRCPYLVSCHVNSLFLRKNIWLQGMSLVLLML